MSEQHGHYFSYEVVIWTTHQTPNAMEICKLLYMYLFESTHDALVIFSVFFSLGCFSLMYIGERMKKIMVCNDGARSVVFQIVTYAESLRNFYILMYLYSFPNRFILKKYGPSLLNTQCMTQSKLKSFTL